MINHIRLSEIARRVEREDPEWWKGRYVFFCNEQPVFQHFADGRIVRHFRRGDLRRAMGVSLSAISESIRTRCLLRGCYWTTNGKLPEQRAAVKARRCLFDGVRYESIKHAVEATGLTRRQIEYKAVRLPSAGSWSSDRAARWAGTG